MVGSMSGMKMAKLFLRHRTKTWMRVKWFVGGHEIYHTLPEILDFVGVVEVIAWNEYSCRLYSAGRITP